MEIHYKIPEHIQRATIDIIFRNAVQIKYINPNISLRESGGKSEFVNKFIFDQFSIYAGFFEI